MHWGEISHASQDPAQYDVDFDDGDKCMQIGASCVFSQKWAMDNIPNLPARVQPKTNEGETADNNDADDADDKSTATAIASIVDDHEEEKDNDGDEDFFPQGDDKDEDDKDDELIAPHDDEDKAAKAEAKGELDADTEEEPSPKAGSTSKSASASASIETKPHRSVFGSNNEYLSSLFGGTGKKAGPKPPPAQLGKRAPKAGKRLVGTHPGSNKQLIDDSTRKQFKLSLKHDHKLMPMMTPISKADGFNPSSGKYTVEELKEACIELIALLAVSLCSCLHIFIT